MQPEIVFVKLGGSLITQKHQAHTPRHDEIDRLAAELALAMTQRPNLRVLLGHGSGSFGHHAAAKYGTRAGVTTPQGWLGFAEVWQEARALNQVVIQSLAQAGLPAVAFPPSAWLLSSAGQVQRAETQPLALALEHGLLPVVQGDVVFDTLRGGTIFSTEEVFSVLVPLLNPRWILLAGVDEGVWMDYPDRNQLLAEITPDSFNPDADSLQGSAHTDVTGGMREKVLLMLSISRQYPSVAARIFSGTQPGNLVRALLGEPIGTHIHA